MRFETDWASPYAKTYEVEYWVGKDALDFDEGPQGEWKNFLPGVVRDARGGPVTLRRVAVQYPPGMCACS